VVFKILQDFNVLVNILKKNIMFDLINDKIIHMLTLKQIDYALAVAKNLHFKKAADECFISPSTLSNAISELEAHLQVKIFERNNKKVIVTNLGQKILDKAKQIKLDVHHIHELAKHDSQALNYNLSIGIIPTISPYFLPLILPKIEKKFSNINLRIEEDQSDSLTHKVREGDLDMAIIALPYDLNGLVSLKFWEEDFYLISNNKNKYHEKAEIKANQLDQAQLMLLDEGHCLKDHILDACNFLPSAKYSIKASTLNTLIQLVKGNMGTTLVPKMAINELINNKSELSISHLNEPGPHREIALVVRKNYAGMDSAMSLVKFFKNSLNKVN